MKNLRKQLTLILTFAIVMTLIPAAAFADDPPVVLPDGTVGTTYNTVLLQTNSPFTSLEMQGRPNGLYYTYNEAKNTVYISGTPTVVGVYTFTVTVRNDNDTVLASKKFTITVNAPTQNIAPRFLTSANLPSESLGHSVDMLFITAVAYPSITGFRIEGDLPPGMQFSYDAAFSPDSCRIYGKPTREGKYTFTAIASNGVGPDAVRQFTIRIAAAPDGLSINAALGEKVDWLASVHNPERLPITWNVLNGSLPPGLTLITKPDDGEYSCCGISGKLTKEGEYSFDIIAKFGNETEPIKVGYYYINIERRAVTGVRLSEETLKLNVGKKATLKAEVFPSNATDKTITWKSSNTKVATVSSAGVVTAKAPGKANITVTTNDGKETATCVVMVGVPDAKTLKLNKTKLALNKGKTAMLKVTVTPIGAEYGLKWTTSDKKVATISSTGVVKGIKKGKATITAKTVNGKKATCAVTVK